MIVVAADTHAIVWELFGDPRLSPAARSAMAVGPGRQVAISAISLAEILYLEEKGRLPVGTRAGIEGSLARAGATLAEVPVTGSIVTAMSRVPRGDVPDLPDRIIAATALSLGVPLVSRDRKIRASAISTVW